MNATAPCPKCNASNPVGKSYCDTCGASMTFNGPKESPKKSVVKDISIVLLVVFFGFCCIGLALLYGSCSRFLK